MITVKEAVELAKNFGQEVFQQGSTIEEVEINDKYWLITLGFDKPIKTTMEKVHSTTDTPSFLGSLNLFGSQNNEKEYKIFKVDGETKQVVSAKIRKL